ncbi:MAG TPA: glycosyl hydrolase family 18 protein, partial [Stenotrophomonas sp.]
MSQFKRWRWLAAGVLLGSLLTAQAAAPAAKLRLVGYVVGGAEVPAITPGKLDVINFAFAQVDPAHRVFLPAETAPSNLRQLVALRTRQPGLRIVLSIGGWGAG